MSSKKNSIAIIRGGSTSYHRSMKSGANVVLSLLKYTDLVSVLDVVVDENEDWFEKGVPSDPHKVFSKVDYYIDLTDNRSASYHSLSRKLDVKPVFQNDYISALNRINIRRILDQMSVCVPRYFVIRDSKNLEHNLKNLWHKFHLPVIIKESNHRFNEESLLTYSFVDAFKKIQGILRKKKEALIEEHVCGKYISVAVVPDYRGEDIYIPTPVETISLDDISSNTSVPKKHLIQHTHEKKSLVHIDESLKKEIKRLVEEIYKSFPLDYHTLIDMVLSQNKNDKSGKSYTIKVLEIHTEPQLFEDSRFDFILKNSGVDLGRLIIDRIQKLEEIGEAY